MNYYLNGVQRGVVSTAVGQHVTIMDRVEVQNGRLTVRLSGASPVMLNAIAAVRINTHTTPPGGPSYAAGQYYVALENLSNGTIMRMKVDLQAGGSLCPQGVLLSPNTAYREYAYSVDQNTVGYSDFVTSATGTFDMPDIVMGKHLTKSTDGSGLEKLAEFIIGLPSNGTGKTASGITYLQALKDGLDPTAGIDDYYWNEFAADRTRSLPEADRRAYAAAYARPGRMRAAWAYFDSFPQAATDFARLSQTPLPMPVLSIGGAKANGEALGQQAKRIAANATAITLPDTGHWLMEERPRETTDALVRFLAADRRPHRRRRALHRCG